MVASILIVEDHEKVRKALRNLLEARFSHFQVIEASSAEEAIDLTLSEAPYLIIMDISLPGMNGIEATRKVRAIPSPPRVVIFTIHEDDIYREEARDAGATAYVAKHALQSELMPKLLALLPADKKIDLSENINTYQ
ncbi:MAG: response regulator transcription factor [Chloroflexota bacterium]|nr:MAG: response regulator transcription factor [Chloroflexota bacterium]